MQMGTRSGSCKTLRALHADVVGYIMRWFPPEDAVTHPSANRARRNGFVDRDQRATAAPNHFTFNIR